MLSRQSRISFVARLYIQKQEYHWFVKEFKFENVQKYSSGGLKNQSKNVEDIKYHNSMSGKK